MVGRWLDFQLPDVESQHGQTDALVIDLSEATLAGGSPSISE